MASLLMFAAPKSIAPLEKKMENNSTVTEQQNWRDLPHDVLLLISSRLSLLDLLNLNDVCSSWRIAMRNRTRIAYPALVLLAQPKENLMKISDLGIDDHITNEILFLCINKKTKYKLKKRSWFVDQYDSRIIGSHRDGWVIISDATWQYSYQYREVYLVHLFSEIQIQLPTNMMDTTTGLVKFIGGSITKATLSANGQNLFVVAITSNYETRDNKLALWKCCDSNWTSFGGESRHIADIAVCNNTIYALHGSGSFRKYLEVWELERNRSFPKKKFCIELPHACHSDHELQRLHTPSDDEIFVVDFNRFSRSGQQLVIFKLDSREKQWIKVRSFDGQTLLSCFGNSVILSSFDIECLGYKANSIYLVRKEQKHIRVSIYLFDDIEGIYKLNETSSCMRDEYQQMQPFGLFLRYA